MAMLNVESLGQVFTPRHIVDTMLRLAKNARRLENPRFLEPSCGDGAFLRHLPNNAVGVEIDTNLCADSALESKIVHIDFFALSLDEKFDCIIGNPPYVRYQDIVDSTKILLNAYQHLFDLRSNLYLFFIYKSILHLNDRGELIFITPRDFLKSTSSVRLNTLLFAQGTITDFIDLGDKKVFEGAQPNCAIWRFEKGNFERHTSDKKEFRCVHGQIFFTKKHYCVPFGVLFFVKVGAVSGADSIFAHDELGNMEFVCSETAKNGKTRRMIYGDEGKNCAYLQGFKEQLLQRKIRKFDASNWWQWGRDYYHSDKPRIYVNAKTRNQKPFFIHACTAYDGSILAIFPTFHVDSKGLYALCERLNAIDWAELGFVCDGRFLFSQRSLENCLLDESFKEFLD